MDGVYNQQMEIYRSIDTVLQGFTREATDSMATAHMAVPPSRP